jgi:preprotein translocase SecE subunit
MAESKESPKKPRIRKSAPTIRERVEAEQAKAEKPKKSSKVKGLASHAKRPFKAVAKRRPRVPQNKFFRLLGKVFHPVVWLLNKLVPRYFINAWKELRLVTWTSRRETWRLTFAVFVFATIFGAIAYMVDKGLDEIFKKFVLK